MTVTFPRRTDYKTRAEIDALVAQVYAEYPANRQGRRAAPPGVHPSWTGESVSDVTLTRADFDAVLVVLRGAARHDEVDDCWYSCALITCDDERRSDVCDCGAQSARDVLARIAPEVLAEVVAMDPDYLTEPDRS